MYMDMMIAYHLISSQTKMDVIIPITEYSNVDAKDFKTTFGKAHIETLLVGEFAGYLSKIGLGILAIYDEINHILHKEELYDILIQNEMPLIPVLSLMERKGIKNRCFLL